MADAVKPLARFDGAAAWATLAPEQQAAVGAAALEMVAFGYLEEWSQEQTGGDPRAVRVAEASDFGEFIDRLNAAFVDAIPLAAIEAGDGTPLVPSTLGDLCRGCGCSDNDPCAEGCGWAAPGLCTACANQETTP